MEEAASKRARADERAGFPIPGDWCALNAAADGLVSVGIDLHDVDGMQLARIDAVDSLATAVLAHLLTVAETFKRHTPKVKGRRKGPAWEERPAPPAPDVWASICKRGGINGHALSIVRQAGSGAPVSAACASCRHKATTL